MAAEDLVGRVVEFIDSGRLKIGQVVRQTKEKLQVGDLNGKQHRVAVRQLIVCHAATPSASEFPELATALEAHIEELKDEIDTELLWESVGGGSGEQPLEALADEYFGSRETPQLSAVFRAVLADPVHFRLKGHKILLRNPEQVTDQLNTLRRREERRAFRKRGMAWMAEVLDSAPESQVPVPEDLEALARRLEDFVLRNKVDDLNQWLIELKSERASQREPRELAFDLLVRVGRLPEDADERLTLAGIHEIFPEKAIEEVEALEPFGEGTDRRDFGELVSFSIDDADTREIDDALTVQPNDDGGLIIGVHIADVAHFVARDSALDREASRRGATVYLPHRSVPMFPERLSCKLASLVSGELRPTLSFEVSFDAGGAMTDWSMGRGQVRVAHRLTYEEADAILASDHRKDALATALRDVERVARKLHAARRERGAILVRRPELKIRVVDGEIDVKVIDPSPSRDLVSEMMVLINKLSARYARENDLALIYRAQDSPSESVEQPEEYDPVAVDRLFRTLRKSRLSLHPQNHFGLGVEAYTQLTSPIRRYQDLVIQRQVAAHLSGSSPPYQSQELLEVLGTAQVVETDNRVLERETNQYYVLQYIQGRYSDATLSATVVHEGMKGLVVELTELPVRGNLATSANHEPGHSLSVAVEHVDPENGRLTLRPV